MRKHNQLELAERVDAASAKARELKTELEAAQRRIAVLMAEKEAKGASSTTPPSAPKRDWKSVRRNTGGKVMLMAGLATASVALLIWGGVVAIQSVSNEPIPPVATASDAGPEPGGADLDQPLANTEAVVVSPVPPAEALDLAAAQRQIAGLSAEVEASDRMIARLRDELRLARQTAGASRGTGSGGAEGGSATSEQDSGLAVAVTTARVVELQKELEAARQQIRDLSAAASKAEAEAAQLRGELAARQDVATAAHENGADRPQEPETVAVIPVIEEVLAAAEIAPAPAAAEAAPVRDTVSPEDLLLNPSQHFGRQVVVTGSVVWLLRRYWLQSDDANRSLLIDVDGLQSEVRGRLKDSVAKIDHLALARARITGTIERQGSNAYRLAATELVLVE